MNILLSDEEIKKAQDAAFSEWKNSEAYEKVLRGGKFLWEAARDVILRKAAAKAQLAHLASMTDEEVRKQITSIGVKIWHEEVSVTDGANEVLAIFLAKVEAARKEERKRIMQFVESQTFWAGDTLLIGHGITWKDWQALKD